MPALSQSGSVNPATNAFSNPAKPVAYSDGYYVHNKQRQVAAAYFCMYVDPTRKESYPLFKANDRKNNCSNEYKLLYHNPNGYKSTTKLPTPFPDLNRVLKVSKQAA